MKGLTALIAGAALSLAGCTESEDYVNSGAAEFLSNAGWKYVPIAETVKEKDCSSQFPGFWTRVVKVSGVNPEGIVDSAEICCIVEMSSYSVIFTTHYNTHAGYCDFLKQ